MKSSKSLVYILIFLLICTSIVSLYQPAEADDGWTDIATFPYTINASGNYRVTTAWTSTTGDTSALTINADDVVVDGQNYLLNLTYTSGSSSGVYSMGHSNILLENLNIASGYYGIRLVSCSNFTINGCSSTNCTGGLSTNICYDFSISLYNSTKDIMSGISVNSCEDFSLDSCNVYYVTRGSNGVYLFGSNFFSATNLSISRCYMGFTASYCDHYVLRDSSINRTSNMGCWVGNGQNATVTNCTFDLNTGYAIYSRHLTDFIVTQNTITNNSQGIKVGSSTMLFSDNYVATNGIYKGHFYGGVYAQDSTCNITGNTFEGNYDAIMWVPEDSAVTATCTVTGNVFEGNSYTFYFAYLLPLGSTSQKLVFSNNLVNDTTYFDADCLRYCSIPIADGVISLNSTMQLGTRPYSNGPQVSGNFWTHPDGTGLSVTGADADKDGFIDATFDLFNDAAIASAVDYHPYSTQFDSNNWVSFTLPATITQPGKYKIASAWTGNSTALTVSASNVTVDGQANQIQLTVEEPAIYLISSTNILLKNINETGARHGLYSEFSNFTVQNSIFTNNTDLGIGAFGSINTVIQNTRLSNNSYGLATIFSINFTVIDCHIKNNTYGIETIFTENVTLSGSYLNSNDDTAALVIYGFNTSITNSTFIDNTRYALALQTSSNTTLRNCNLTNTEGPALYATGSDFTAANCNFNNNYLGIKDVNGQFNVTNSNLNNNMAGVLGDGSNCGLENSNITFSREVGIIITDGDISISKCNISNDSYFGVYAIACNSVSVKNSTFSNNTYVGIEAYGCNLEATGNTFTSNGINVEGSSGGIMVEDSNCTVTQNTFRNNYDALLIGVYSTEKHYTQTYCGNQFQNNSYTFDFNYHLPSNYTNQQIYFYNNLVNDTTYVNPASFTYDYQLTPPNTVLHLNTTIQAGARIYGVGSMIGGNYWAHPNGTGPSQTGKDTNHDGFIDTKFDFFNNATIGVYDCLPLSTNYSLTLAYTAGASQTIGINQMSNVLTVQATDAFGNVTSGLTVNLASSCVTGSFYSDAAGTKQITSVMIPVNSSSASFYYRDSAWGDRTITVYANYANSAVTPLTIPSPTSSSSGTTTSPSPTATPTATPTPTPAPTPITGTIQATKDNNSQLTLSINGNIAPTQFSNITLTTNQTAATTALSFTVTGETDTTGFCNITIPKTSIAYGSTPVVMIDGQRAANQGYTEDANNYYVWFTTSFSTHQVAVQFSNTPMPTNITDTSNAYWWLTPAAAIIGIALVSIVIAIQMKRRTSR